MCQVLPTWPQHERVLLRPFIDGERAAVAQQRGVRTSCGPAIVPTRVAACPQQQHPTTTPNTCWSQHSHPTCAPLAKLMQHTSKKLAPAAVCLTQQLTTLLHRQLRQLACAQHAINSRKSCKQCRSGPLPSKPLYLALPGQRVCLPPPDGLPPCRPKTSNNSQTRIPCRLRQPDSVMLH